MTEPTHPPFEEVFGDGLFTDTDPASTPALNPAQLFADIPDAAVGSHVDSGTRRARFDGDSSELPAEACWALQELVAAPHISDKARHHWSAVLQYEDVLRSRLSELGLVLEINREHRYAFTRQADDPNPRSRTILRTRTLSLAASALALYLYQQYVTSPDDPIVETADMLDHMIAYKRADDTDDAGFQKKIKAAINALDDAAIIKPIKGTSRYIIYGVITSILTAEQVSALHDRYLAIARGGLTAAADAPQDEVTDD
jgi:Domain of unknown function (DUF4194)